MKPTRFNLLPALLLLAAILLGGCESESVAPNDQLPPLSAETAIKAAGKLSFYLNSAYGVYQDAIAKAGGKDKSVESFVAGGVSGTYTLDFFCGDSPCESGLADKVRAYTAAGQSVEVRQAPGDELPLVTCFFDATAFPYDNTEGGESGNVNGSGTLHAGDYTTEFSVEDVFLSISDYPPSGALAYDAGDHHVVVHFNGTRFASLAVGEDMYLVDLDTGNVTPI